MADKQSHQARSIAIETVALAILLGGLVWSLPPDVNEAHYLAKAKHFWDRSYCVSDLFVTSHETHWLFYATHGWLCRFLEFEVVAWVGRMFSWLVTAWGLVMLGRQFFGRPGDRLLMGCLVVILNLKLNLAGEWFVGGVEGKCYAYGFAFAGLAMWLEGKYSRFAIFLSVACAFHIVVGLWVLIAWAFACLLERFLHGVPVSTSLDSFRFDFRFLLTLLTSGAFFLTGFLPAITQNAGVSNDMIILASKAQFLWRLAHHQLATEFTRWFYFIPMVVAWAILARENRRTHDSRLLGLNLLVLGSLLISTAGVIFSLIAINTQDGFLKDISARILTLYCFRLADVLVPLGCVINFFWLVRRLPKELSADRVAMIAITCLILVSLFLNARSNIVDRRSRSAAQSISMPNDSNLRKREIGAERNWIKTCRWIRNNTPRDAQFITPLDQQTFKWYAWRSEVANRKDMPQDAESVVQWLARLKTLYQIDVKELMAGKNSDESDVYASDRKNQVHPWLALEYQNKLPFDAGYLIIEQWILDEFEIDSRLSNRLVQIYPVSGQRKSTFAVFRMLDHQSEK